MAGELAAKVFPVLLMPYLTRSLGVTGYGELAFYLSIIQLMGIFIGFSSHAAISRYYFRYGMRSIGLPITAAILFGCAVSVLCGFVALIFELPLAWLLSISALGNCLLACGLSILQCQKRVGNYVVFQFINLAFSTLLTIILLELYVPQAEYRIVALAIGSILTALLLQVMLKNIRYSWSMHKLRLGFVYLLSFGAPLLIHGVCNFLRFEFDKIALKSVFTLEQLGVYALAAKLGAIVQLVLFAINKSLQPLIYEAMKKGDAPRLLSQLQFPAFFSVLVVPSIALILPEEILLWVFGEEFAGIKSLVVTFTLGYALLAPYFLFSNVAFYLKWTKLISAAALVSVVAYIGVFYLCVTMGWLNYIPWALVVSSFILTAIIIVPVRRKVFI